MKIEIDRLQPHERRLSVRKLARVRWMYASGLVVPEPHIIPFDKRYIVVDGNHRTYVAYERNQEVIDAILDEPRRTDYVNPIIELGITKFSDLTSKILTHEEWQRSWDMGKFSCFCNFDDELTDDDFFKKYPEVEPFCSYRK